MEPNLHQERQEAHALLDMLSRPGANCWMPLTLGHKCPTIVLVKGAEFIRRLRKLARQNQLACHFIADKGKGSHGRIYLGREFTTLKDRKKEIGSDLLAKMCRDLKIDPHEL